MVRMAVELMHARVNGGHEMGLAGRVITDFGDDG